MRIIHLFFASVISFASALADVKPPLILLPKDAAANESLPVAVWLHGYGANPSKIIEEPLYQAVADRLHIAIVGVYATNQIGSDAFEWSELPTFDYPQVLDSLQTAERSKHIRFSTKALFGFSQGACVAAELASRHPDMFSGAIILSPGGNTSPGPIPNQEANHKQLFYLSCGADEAPGNIQFTRSYSNYLSRTGATVHSREVPGMKVHNRPPDWPDRFPDWIAAILGVKH